MRLDGAHGDGIRQQSVAVLASASTANVLRLPAGCLVGRMVQLDALALMSDSFVVRQERFFFLLFFAFSLLFGTWRRRYSQLNRVPVKYAEYIQTTSYLLAA